MPSHNCRRLGRGRTFQRMWNLYLAYSETGFRSGYLNVHQLLLEPREIMRRCAPGTAGG
jgi:cyclopropane fatty-acyl-phospholipid synthase-like methyltransferase